MAEDALPESHIELQPNPGGIKLGPLWLQPGISPRNVLTAYISSAAFGMRTDMKLSVALNHLAPTIELLLFFVRSLKDGVTSAIRNPFSRQLCICKISTN